MVSSIISKIKSKLDINTIQVLNKSISSSLVKISMMIATLDSVIISILIVKNFKSAFSVKLIELIKKILLYFINERDCIKINYGI